MTRAVPVYEVDDEVALLDLRAAVVRPVVHRLVRRLRRLAKPVAEALRVAPAVDRDKCVLRDLQTAEGASAR